ncbi:MAG: hypothetical protein LBD09_05700, partial [Treponema sp.]|nr:hypothetical protein [Treponema sp.]
MGAKGRIRGSFFFLAGLFHVAAVFFFCAAAGVFFSCAGTEEARPPSLSVPAPPPRSLPPLTVLDYQNREAGPLEPWLRSYLSGGIAACESLEAYRGSYLFVARVYSLDREVVTQWLEHFSPEQDFARLAAERIRLRMDRMDRDPAVSSGEKYGPYFEQTLRAAYGFSWRGSRRAGGGWVRGTVSGEDREWGRFPPEPLYWGFVLMAIPRDTLEVQISGLLAGVEQSLAGKREGREYRGAFENLKERFFE